MKSRNTATGAFHSRGSINVPRTRVIRSLRISFLIFLCLCALVSTQSVSTQKSFDPPCTILELRCPTYLVSGTAPITLHGDIRGKEILGDEGMKRFTYTWRVSGATVNSSQGTSEVVLDALREKGKELGCINVTVQVKGLPPTCESEKSCTLSVSYSCDPPERFDDQYAGLSRKDEELHLDKIAGSLGKKGSDSVLYIVAYAGRSACISEAEWRANRAKKYLVETHGIPDDRIVAVDGGFRENLAIELFVLAKNACGPFPTPTVRASAVQISGLCANKYNQRQ